MTNQIAADDIADLCLGSTFLATGGGGDPYVSQLLVEAALRRSGPIELISAGSLPEQARIVALGEVGAPSVSLEHLPAGNECLVALERFEQWQGEAVTHVVPFEIGGANSVIPILAAATKDVGLIDGDGMARALPEAQMMTYAIEGIRPTPAVAVNDRGEAVYFDTGDVHAYERQVRQIAMAMGGMVFTVEHPMTAVQAKRAIVPGTVSFALRLGRVLREQRGAAEDLLPHLKSLFKGSVYGKVRQLFAGKVADLTRQTVGGFDVGEITLEPLTAAGPEETMRIALKNEYLVAWRGEEVVASVPDLIVILDHATGTPINSERLGYGQRVVVFGIGCPAHYLTERALEVVSPKAFGFEFDFFGL